MNQVAEARSRRLSGKRHSEVIELVEHLPMPGLILENDATVLFENGHVGERISRKWLDGATKRLLALSANGRARALEIPDPQGEIRAMTAYSMSLGNETVVMFDDRVTDGGAGQATMLHQRIVELEQLSATDRLTGLWNRRHFDEVIERELAFSGRQHSPVSLILFDLDHFKKVNDTFGHGVGDAVLRAAASRLGENGRATDFLFRWGGEEFALLAPATSISAAARVADRLRVSFCAQPFDVVGSQTASAGVAEHLLDEPVQQWFERVDDALYQAKESGRNRVAVSAGGASEIWLAREQSSALQLVWSDSCVSGHRLIDDEHRGLFDATNALVAAMTDSRLESATVIAQVEDILAAAAHHFVDEEKVLAEIRYPGLDGHRKLHEKLLGGARRLLVEVRAGTSSPGEIVEFLAYEVVNRHVLKADRLFFPYLADPPAT